MPMVGEADGPRMRGALLRIQTDLSKIAETKLATVPDRLLSSVGYMVKVFPRPNIVPAHYVLVFEETADLLDSIDAAKGENAQIVVNDLDEDFEVIVRNSQPNEIGSVRPVFFTVQVLKDGAEVKGWEIFYMEYFLRNVRKEIGPNSFPQPSTSSYLLAPGRYLFQARTSNGKATERKECTVSSYGGQRDCVLLAP